MKQNNDKEYGAFDVMKTLRVAKYSLPDERGLEELRKDIDRAVRWCEMEEIKNKQ